MDIHERLNTLLKQSGMSRYKLSKVCDIPEETLTGIFKRRHIPTIATLEAICDGLGITLSQFFSENDMFEMTSEIKELLEVWIHLTPEKRQNILQTMKFMQ